MREKEEEMDSVQDSIANNQYFCGHCKMSLMSLQDLKEHLETLHSQPKNASTKFACKVCHLELASKKSLRHHKKYVHDMCIKPFKCEKCSKAFKWKNKTEKQVFQTLKREHQ